MSDTALTMESLHQRDWSGISKPVDGLFEETEFGEWLIGAWLEFCQGREQACDQTT